MVCPDLYSSPLFKGLPQKQIKQLACLLDARHFDEATLVFEQGEPALYLYLLVAGRVIIRFKPYDGPPLHVAEIEAGGVFGWSAVMNRSMYTSSAMAVEDCDVYRISTKNFKTLYSQNPQTGDTLLERLTNLANLRSPNAHQEVISILQSCLVE